MPHSGRVRVSVSLRAGLLLFFAIGSVALCLPFIDPRTPGPANQSGDVLLLMWTLLWHAHWPAAGLWPMDAPMFAPEPGGLAYAEPLLTVGLLVAPITRMAGAAVAFDVLRVCTPWLNGVLGTWMAWHYLRDRAAALVAGVAFAWSYALLSNVYIGLFYLSVFWGLLATAVLLDRWWTGQRGSDLVLAILSAVAQALVSWYVAVLVLMAIAGQVTWLAWLTRDDRPRLVRRLAALAVAGLIAVGLLWPLAGAVARSIPAAREEARLYSARPDYYVVPPENTPLGRLIVGRREPVGWDFRRAYYLGVVAAGLAVAGTCWLVVRRAALPVGVVRLLWVVPVGLAGMALSFGPSAPGEWWRPFDLVAGLPGLSGVRVPARLAPLATLMVAMLAGVAVSAWRPRRGRAVGVAAIVALLVADAYSVALPPPVRQTFTAPRIFRVAAAQSPSALLVLPMQGGTMAWIDEADYLMAASPTWIPIVNGYGRRTSPIYQAVQGQLAGFPSTRLAETLAFFGIDHVVVLRGRRASDVEPFIAAADRHPAFARVAEVDGDVLYRVASAR